MKKFTTHQGVAAPLLRLNIDTDAIIPSREMKRVSKEGLGDGLFAGWRYLKAGSYKPNPEFVLNQPSFSNATVLLSGKNFGCGSSREHAVWALKEYGIRVIIANSFGAIFYNNCICNGLLPISLPEPLVIELARQVSEDPQRLLVSVDLQSCIVRAPDGSEYPFKIEPSHREMLLEGLDPIAVTLKLDERIAQFCERDSIKRPWNYSG